MTLVSPSGRYSDQTTATVNISVLECSMYTPATLGSAGTRALQMASENIFDVSSASPFQPYCKVPISMNSGSLHQPSIVTFLHNW